VRRVVDRQTPITARVDVCERAIGKLCSLLRAKRRHAQMIARTGAADFPAAPEVSALMLDDLLKGPDLRPVSRVRQKTYADGSVATLGVEVEIAG
jgi:hypothetical protein